VVQPLLGVAFGFLALLALETDLISVGGGTSDWAATALLGFVAGFSEPFSLRLVDGVAGIGEGESQDTTGMIYPCKDSAESQTGEIATSGG
jgi:hypothetical protein